MSNRGLSEREVDVELDGRVEEEGEEERTARDRPTIQNLQRDTGVTERCEYIIQ